MSTGFFRLWVALSGLWVAVSGLALHNDAQRLGSDFPMVLFAPPAALFGLFFLIGWIWRGFDGD
jgi:hypothetical protein